MDKLKCDDCKYKRDCEESERNYWRTVGGNAAETIREVMTNYNTYRERWGARYGTYDGFDKWFTGQVQRLGEITEYMGATLIDYKVIGEIEVPPKES